jgi:drug/metabolite transporter (DMT)-like permease
LGVQPQELRLKQEITSLVQAAIGLVIVALVLTGIGGTIYKVISPEGWIAQAFGRSVSAGAAALGSLLLIAMLAWFSRGWSSPRYRNRFSDLLVYGFAAAGFGYVAMFVAKGTF